MTLLEEFAQLLEHLGLGTYTPEGVGGTIYLAALPTTPDECMAIARYGGSESDSRLPYDEPSMQVRVRGTAADARTGEQQAQDVYDALHGLGSRELAGGTWLQLAIGVNGGPAYIGRDGNGRHEWTVNFRCEISRTTPTRSES
jgi:hypothetical protein